MVDGRASGLVRDKESIRCHRVNAGEGADYAETFAEIDKVRRRDNRDGISARAFRSLVVSLDMSVILQPGCGFTVTSDSLEVTSESVRLIVSFGCTTGEYTGGLDASVFVPRFGSFNFLSYGMHFAHTLNRFDPLFYSVHVRHNALNLDVILREIIALSCKFPRGSDKSILTLPESFNSHSSLTPLVIGGSPGGVLPGLRCRT